MKKPELIVTPHDIHEIKDLIEAGADAFIIGEEKFGLRLAGEFKLNDLREAIELIKQHNKKVYVAINALMPNSLLDELKTYIQEIKSLPIDALRFSDPGAYMIAKEVAPNMTLHWSSETLGTNYFTVNYWYDRGVERTVLAPEMMKDATLETKAFAKGEIEILVHGAICMFHSRRNLVGNYLKFQGQVVEKVQTREEGLLLFDPERNLYYPVFEDEQGTHIFNGCDVCMIDDLAEFIEAGVDSIRIDGILKSNEYLVNVTKAYRLAIDMCVEDREKYNQIGRALYKKLEEIQPNNRQLDRGFFYKPSIYKHK